MLATQDADLITEIRAASRELVRELGLLDKTTAGTHLSASAVHAILEIGLSPGVSAKELAARLKLEKSTVSRLVKSLEKQGEIIQTRSETDGRSSGLSLTDAGEQSRSQINQYGDEQVRSALRNIKNCNGKAVLETISAYAKALKQPTNTVVRSHISNGCQIDSPTTTKGAIAHNLDDLKQHKNGTNSPTSVASTVEIVEGYQTGMIGDIAALHARTHGAIIGSGPTFESLVSKAMAEFMTRMDHPANNSWSIIENKKIIGSISIDGEDLGHNKAHLRWFILDEKLRGQGFGKKLLLKALTHCDTAGFEEICLWTVKGLDTAKALYEKYGFTLVEEYIGHQWGQAITEQKYTRFQKPCASDRSPQTAV